MDFFYDKKSQLKDEIFEIGKEFAFEGLSEDDFKANNEDELERFRQGYKIGLKMQPEVSIPTDTFKNVHK